MAGAEVRNSAGSGKQDRKRVCVVASPALKEPLKWMVYVDDDNHKKIVEHNVFDHSRFLEDCKKNARKNIHNYDEFCRQLRIDLAYYYWSKFEWEIIISSWPSYGESETKVDVFDQVMLNWQVFCDYTWAHGAELRRREKKNDGKTV